MEGIMGNVTVYTYSRGRRRQTSNRSSSLESTLPSHNSIVRLMGPRMTWEMSLWA